MKPIDNRNSNSELSISDISRSIVREYLIRHHCSSTLSAFEAEDRLNSRRIPRQVLLTSLKIGDTFAGGSSNG